MAKDLYKKFKKDKLLKSSHEAQSKFHILFNSSVNKKIPKAIANGIKMT